jgi:hypothetical protein
MTEDSRAHRDSIGFIAEQLGKAKSEGERIGQSQIVNFQHIETLIEQLREHGISISPNQVTFQGNPVTQAAWQAYIRHDQGPPMMQDEEEIERDIKANAG